MSYSSQVVSYEREMDAQGVNAKREQISHKPDNSRTDNPEFSVLEYDLCVCM
jgi:hypothetical protein